MKQTRKGIRDEISKGKIGRVRQVTGYYSNGLHNNAGHMIDLILWLLKDKIMAVRGFKNDCAVQSPQDMNVDSILWTKKGTVIMLQSFDQSQYAIHDIRIYGDKGLCVIDEFGTRTTWIPARTSKNFARLKELYV